MESNHPLIEVAEHVRAEARHARVAVVFDLDSTLFCVSPRTQHILRQLGQEAEFSADFAAAAEILRHIEVLPTDYSVREVLMRTSVQPSAELVKQVRDYWRKHFFSSHFLDKDNLYPSANEYVRHLHDLGASILYLTGRNEPNMREGTVRALHNWGFPLFKDSDLLMKPRKDDQDETFKVQALQDLARTFPHIWFFENEPLIINDVRAQVPQAHIVFVNSVHSGKARAPTDLRTMAPDFRPGLPRKAPTFK